jgi:hypothetical protein
VGGAEKWEREMRRETRLRREMRWEDVVKEKREIGKIYRKGKTVPY